MRRFLYTIIAVVAMLSASPTQLCAESFELQPMFNATSGEMKPNLIYMTLNNNGGKWTVVYETLGTKGEPIAVNNVLVVRDGTRIMFSLEDDGMIYIDKPSEALAIEDPDAPNGWMILLGMSDFDQLYSRIKNSVENSGAESFDDPKANEPEQTNGGLYTYTAVDFATSVLGWNPEGETRMQCEDALRQAGLNFCDKTGFLTLSFSSGGECDNPYIIALDDAPFPVSTALYIYYGSATNVYRWNFSFDSIEDGVQAADAEKFFTTACNQLTSAGYKLQQVSNPPPYQQVMTTQIDGHKVSVGIFRADYSRFVYIDYDK